MGRQARSSFGALRKLPSKRWQASYTGPDGARHNAPTTFTVKLDAQSWLIAEHKLIEAGDWTPPKQRIARATGAPVLTVQRYADAWLADRVLRPKTRDGYRRLLDRLILPSLGTIELAKLTKHTVKAWHTSLGTNTPRQTRAAVSLLSTICRTAVDDDDLLPANPVQVKLGSNKRARQIRTLEPAEVDALADAMPERYRLMIYIGAYLGLRYGEVAELRRKDFDMKRRVLSVKRGVSWAEGQPFVGPPKTDAGIRELPIPAALTPLVAEHLATHCQWGREGLLFPSGTGGHLRAETFHKNYFRRARTRADLEGVTFHGLRHTAAVMAAEAGTLADVQQFLGHTTVAAAMIYQHASRQGAQRIADHIGSQMA